MRKKLKIEIGSDLNIVNGIGFFLIIFGLLIFVVSGIVLLSGILLPLEMKVIYFVEVISKNFMRYCCSCPQKKIKEYK